jgi:hypothetical protein
MRILKQSTAATLKLGPFVDDSDGVTAMTALTISQADVRLSKAGGAFAQKAETTAGAHDENGYYTILLNTTDTATAGSLLVAISESGALPMFAEYTVLEAHAYDALTAGSGNGILSNAATSVTAASLGADYSSITLLDAMKICTAVLAGKVSGMGTTNVLFRNIADTDDVVDSIVDASGNRSAVTLDP